MISHGTQERIVERCEIVNAHIGNVNAFIGRGRRLIPSSAVCGPTVLRVSATSAEYESLTPGASTRIIALYDSRRR